MPEDVFSSYEKQNKVRKMKAGFIQVEKMLADAITDLNDAKKIVNLVDRPAYIAAYNAMLKAGRALLLMHGYAPDDGSQHKTVVELSGKLLGKNYTELALAFESMRRKRNDMTYEGNLLLSRSEVPKAIDNAISLLKRVLQEAKKRNPQLSLDV
jgi:uncharacterized protein (UPF0332 family)